LTDVRVVIFDWGGTLTPFHQVDLLDLWRVAAARLAPDRADELAEALFRAEREWWDNAVVSGRSGTTHDVVAAACAATGIDVEPLLRDEALEAHLDAWTPHTWTDPDAIPLLKALRERGIALGLLSNTHWPRRWHDHWLERDGILDLLDARVYTSELEHVKPWPEAFRAVLDQVGVAPEHGVMVGDRLLDDISGAQALGMRGIWLRNDIVPGHDVTPSATVNSLSEVLEVIDRWRADG
jgi:putative hydrolase of the HAD superfamily